MKPKRLLPLKYYITELSPYRPLHLNCPVCEHTSTFSSHTRFNTSNGSLYYNLYQCQDCGKLQNSDEVQPKGITVALKEPCECGGQFRRDCNIFCSNCNYRKSDENKFDNKLTATKKKMKLISSINGSEEMTLPFEKSELFEWTSE